MVGTSFVKPNIDKTLYLWSKNAKKECIITNDIVKFPRQPLTNDTNVKQSTVNNPITRPNYLAFNYNIMDSEGQHTATGTYTNGVANFSYGFSGYNGEYIMINIGERFVLNKVAFYPRSGLERRAPGVFRIYGTNDINLFNTPSFASGWTLIHDQTTKRTDYVFGQPTEVSFENYEPFSIYILVVKQLSGFDALLNFVEWELYGVPTEKCVEYNWDIPEITLNQSGKISMEAKAYNSFTPSTTAVSTRIKNVSSKYNYDTANGGGTILNIGHWGSKSKMIKCPPIPLQPQSINEISLSFTHENDTEKGLESSVDFVVVLKITEDDVPPVEWGNSKAVNVRQLAIPTYN